MTIINTKTNIVLEGLGRTQAGRVVGVHRNTVSRWEKKRIADRSFKEIYNHFIIYFPVVVRKKHQLHQNVAKF